MKDDLNEYFDKIIVIFRCLEVIYVLKQGKDQFELQYRSDLAKRLLSGKNFLIIDNYVLTGLEEHMVELLKQECGPAYTNKIEFIITDFVESKTLNNSYISVKIYKNFQSPLYTKKGTESTTAYVISNKIWPLFCGTEEITIPEEIKKEIDVK